MTNEIQFLLYQLPDEKGKVQVILKDETIWATQKAMAQLFGVGVPAISKHLKNIFDTEELDKNTTVSKMEIVVNRGFRVNAFLTFRKFKILPDKGKISREEADRKAEEEYKLFNPKQKIDSDFDKEIRGLFDNKKE